MRPQGPLSVRGRLLTGLVTLTAVFLVVMGAVSAIVLGRLETQQFNDGLLLSVRSGADVIADPPDGYYTAFISQSQPAGQVKDVTGPSRADDALRRYLTGLVAGGHWFGSLRAQQGAVFGINVPGEPALRAAARRSARARAALPR